MRYGENSHQKAWLYEDPIPKKFSILEAEQLHGKKLSYNNIKDADEALRSVREFDEPTVVAMKHMNLWHWPRRNAGTSLGSCL